MQRDAAVYDDALEAGRVPPVPCPVCTGDESAPPCGEDCAALIARCARERRIRGIYVAARRAIAWAKVYRFASFEGVQDQRVQRVIQQVHFYREDIRALRAA